MIFWQSAPPLREAVWLHDSGGDVFLLLETRYEERAPLNPLSGTTYKRRYRTKLAAVRIPRDWPAGRGFSAAPIFAGSAERPRESAMDSDNLAYMRLPDHGGWLLAESLASFGAGCAAPTAGFLPAQGFRLYGNTGNAYGAPERRIYRVDCAGQLTLEPSETGPETKADRGPPRSPAGRRLYHDDATGNFVLQID